MIFRKILLKNFRQYYGEINLSFKQENGSITLVIAENGVGKTTLLQAFRFCFFGESPNALKLPDAEELLNRTKKSQLNEGESVPVSVRVDFSQGNDDFYATREIVFKKFNGKIERRDQENGNFELWKYMKNEGYKKISNDQASDMIREMMPLGLAHIYMFDGERIERPIDSNEFKESLKESITGLLGLKRLQRSGELLGDETHSSSIIGRIHLKEKTITDDDQNIQDMEIKFNKRIQEKERENEEIKTNIGILKKNIDDKKITQKKFDELKDLRSELDKNELRRKVIQERIMSNVKESNRDAVNLYYKLELFKQFDKFEKFRQKGEKEKVKVFDGLYESVIKDILKRGECICGRPIKEDSEEHKHLMELAVLPHDNALYVKQLQNLLENSKVGGKRLYERIKGYQDQRVKYDDEINDLDSKNQTISNEIREKEKKNNLKNLQTNIISLSNTIREYERKIRSNENDINEMKSSIKSNRARISQAQQDNKYNQNVMRAEKILNEIKDAVDSEFEIKEKIAKNDIQENLNSVVLDIFGEEYRAGLNADYSLSMYRKQKVNNREEYIDSTSVLSTGQSVLTYLSFLKALLKTISDRSEFNDVKSGIIMDAALSNVDERHIGLSSKKILNTFDQLIFLSFKRQLRAELFANIKDNISNAYQLMSDSNGNIKVRDIQLDQLEEFINE